MRLTDMFCTEGDLKKCGVWKSGAGAGRVRARGRAEGEKQSRVLHRSYFANPHPPLQVKLKTTTDPCSDGSEN